MPLPSPSHTGSTLHVKFYIKMRTMTFGRSLLTLQQLHCPLDYLKLGCVVSFVCVCVCICVFMSPVCLALLSRSNAQREEAGVVKHPANLEGFFIHH